MKNKIRKIKIICFLIIFIMTFLFLFPREKKRDELNYCTIQLLERHKRYIHYLSETLNLPSTAIAGVIAAELNLNHNYLDSIQDQLFERRFKNKDDEWWNAWVLNGEKLAAASMDMRFKSNKWPISLIKTGYVISFGPAQITPRTAIKAYQSAVNDNFFTQIPIKEIIFKLIHEESSVQMAAFVLNFEAKQFEKYYQYNVRSDLGLLATLYSFGGEYYRYTYGHDELIIKYNMFGDWLVENEKKILEILK